MSRRPRPAANRAGATLIELAVALAILAIAAAVSGIALRAFAAPDAANEGAVRVEAARRRALAERRPVAVAVTDSGGARSAVAYPDGRVVADSALDLDPLSGRPREAPR